MAKDATNPRILVVVVACLGSKGNFHQVSPNVWGLVAALKHSCAIRHDEVCGRASQQACEDN